MKNCFFLLLLLLSYGLTKGQEIYSDSSMSFNGTVLSASDSLTIPNVHVLNLSRGTGAASNSEGNFMITVEEKDTLKFSCIGYHDYYIPIHFSVLRPDILIFLEADTVLMDELRISPLPPRHFFKPVFMETRVPHEKLPDLHIPGIKLIPGYTPQTGIIATGPAQLLYDAFNKKARLNRKLRKNRKKYTQYLIPEGGDSLVYPEKIK